MLQTEIPHVASGGSENRGFVNNRQQNIASVTGVVVEASEFITINICAIKLNRFKPTVGKN